MLMLARRHGTNRGFILKVCIDRAPPISSGESSELTDCLGWGKKLAYCIAFSTDGAADVTRRYVRSAGFALERTRAFESDLLHIINEIRSMRRKSLPLVDKFRLEKEDAGEDRELQRYVALQIAHEFCKIDVANPSFHSSKPLSTDSVKTREGRVSGNAEWVRARGERPFEGI